MGDHGAVTMRRALPVVSPAVLAALLGALVALFPAGPAEAATCSRTVHVQGTVLQVELAPSSVAVRKGSCVVFVNDLAIPVTVSVEPDFDRQVPPGGRVSYPARLVGAHDMSAGTLVFEDTGTVTVRRAPQPSRTSSPPPSKTPPPSSPGSRSPEPPGGSSGPRVAPTPAFTGFPTPSVSTPPGTPPSVAGPSERPDLPSPTASPTGIVAGPIEPASGRGAGLPAAVAALSIVGAGAGLVRVLLAEPVDDLPVVGGRA